jgi:hypothetical protein
MTENRTLIDLDEDAGEAQLWIQRRGKPMISKTVGADDLVSALASGFQITTGILPHGTKFYSGTKNHYRIGVEVPGRRRTTEFSLHMEKLSVEIPFPDMLFVFEISRGSYSSSRAFSVVPPLGLPSNQLYLFPFGNVNHNGQICWGSAARGEVKDAIVLDSAINKFFSSVFSGHYVFGTNTFTPPPKVGDLRQFIRFLEDKDDFSQDLLKPCGMVLSDVMS